MAEIRYSIKYNRMKDAYTEGFEAFQDGSIKSFSAIHNCVYFKPVDTAVADSTFGRLCFDLKLVGNESLNIYVFADNEWIYPDKSTDIADYRRIFKRDGALKFNDVSDILLYELSGRYLYLAFESEGEGDVEISNIKLFTRGDNFMDTFPIVYRERNSFFHRYMSVFSSIYNDLDEEIEKLPELLNLDTCDASLLPIYGRWLGIDVGDGFLEENVLRSLVKESYNLNRMKGTKYCLERISEIILGEKGIVVERNNVEDYLTPSQVADFNRLYGNRLSDVTLMIKRSLDAITSSQLMYILEQFLPINCSLHIVELDSIGTLDGHVYLDINANIYKAGAGSLDDVMYLDGNIILE